MLLALAILLTGVYLFRSFLIAPHVSAYVERAFAAETGLQVKIGDLGGTYFSNLEIKNVTTVSQPSAGQLAGIEFKNLTIAYHLTDLLKGLPEFLASTSVDLRGASVSIDLSADRVSTETEDTITGFQLPQRLPRVHIHESRIQVKGVGYDTLLDGISLQIRRVEPAGSRLKLNVAAWHLDHPKFRKIVSAAEADIFYSGGRIILEKLVVGKQSLVESVVVDLNGLPDKLAFQARLTPAEGRMAANGSVVSNRLDLRLEGSGIDLAQISGLFSSDAIPFGGILALNGSLDLPFADLAGMRSDLDIRVSDGSFGGPIADQLALKFTAGSGQLAVVDAELVSGDNRLTIDRATVPAEDVFAADLDRFLQSLTVSWRLEGSDIPALLKRFGLTNVLPAGPIPDHRLILEGRMQNGDLDIPTGRLETENGRLNLKDARMTLPIADRSIEDSPLAADLFVDLPTIDILGRIFALPGLGGSVKGKIQINGTLRAPVGFAKIFGNSITYRNTVFGSLSLRAKADARQVVIEAASLETGADRAIVRGTLNVAQKSFENLKAELEISDLYTYFSQLLPLIWPQTHGSLVVHGSIKGAINLSGAFTNPSGDMSLRVRQIRIADTPCGNGDVDLKFSGEEITLASALFRNLNDHLQIRGTLHHQEKQLEAVAMRVEISELSAYNGLFRSMIGTVSGSLQGRLQASGDLFNPDGDADMRVENFRLNAIQIPSGSLTLKSANRLLTIAAAVARTDREKIQIAGQVQRSPDDSEFDIKIENASLVRQDLRMGLERPARCRLFRTGRIIFQEVAFVGSAGRVSIGGSFDPDGISDVAITTTNLQSQGWFDWIAGDRIRFQGLDARIRLSGHSAAPFVAVEGTVDSLGGPSLPETFRGKFDVDYRNKSLKIHEFAWNSGKEQHIDLTGTLPLDLNRSDLLAHGPITINGRAWITDARVLDFLMPRSGIAGGSIECDFELTGTWTHPNGAIHLAVKGLPRPAGIRPLPPGPYAVTADLRIDGDTVVLEKLEADSAGWQIRTQGQWSGIPKPADLLRSATPKLTGRLNLEGFLDVSDLSWLAREVDGLRRLRGRLEARGVLQGPITAPSAEAVLQLFDAELAPDVDMPSLRKLNLEAAVSPEIVKISRLDGELGGAPFKIDGSLKLGTAEDLVADLRLQGKNLLLLRDEGLRLRADTDLTLRGPVSRLALGGAITITDGRFSKNFGVIEGFGAVGEQNAGGGGFKLFSIQNPPLSDLQFNVRISAAKPFRVQNNLIRGAIRPDLLLSGTGELPVLTGKLYVEPSRLYLPAGRMELEAGLIRFEPTDPDRPRLDLVGAATMLGYDITAVIDGPYDEPVITLASVPPLPDDELLMLLLTGQPPKKAGSRSEGTKQGMNVAVFIGRDLLSRVFGGDPDATAESILERFDVELGRAISQQGQDTIHSQFRLADDFLREGDSLYLTGERDYWDYYNGGIKLVFRFR